MHIDLCTMCVPGAKGSLMRVLDLLGLEWLSVWVLGIEPEPIGRSMLLTAEPFLQPQDIILNSLMFAFEMFPLISCIDLKT